MSEFKGFFLLQTPTDLLGKLRRDYLRIQADPGDHEAALDFFLTAEHLVDWIYPGQTNCSKRGELRKTVPVLAIVSHIANGAKHFRADAPHHNSVIGETVIEAGLSFPMSFPEIYPAADLVVDLDGALDSGFGPQVRVLDLAAAVLTYWGSYLG